MQQLVEMKLSPTLMCPKRDFNGWASNGCGAGVVKEEDGTLVPTGTQHLHNNHKTDINQMMLCQEIKVRLQNETKNLKEIFDEEVER